jgi:hypothetical protein
MSAAQTTSIVDTFNRERPGTLDRDPDAVNQIDIGGLTLHLRLYQAPTVKCVEIMALNRSTKFSGTRLLMRVYMSDATCESRSWSERSKPTSLYAPPTPDESELLRRIWDAAPDFSWLETEGRLAGVIINGKVYPQWATKFVEVQP